MHGRVDCMQQSPEYLLQLVHATWPCKIRVPRYIRLQDNDSLDNSTRRATHFLGEKELILSTSMARGQTMC